MLKRRQFVESYLRDEPVNLRLGIMITSKASDPKPPLLSRPDTITTSEICLDSPEGEKAITVSSHGFSGRWRQRLPSRLFRTQSGCGWRHRALQTHAPRSRDPHFRLPVIVDEASKLTEHQTVAVLSRFYDRLRKMVLVGDDQQGKPFQVETNSEMGKTVEVSLMTRLVKTGVPINMLIEQYRVHPLYC